MFSMATFITDLLTCNKPMIIGKVVSSLATDSPYGV